MKFMQQTVYHSLLLSILLNIAKGQREFWYLTDIHYDPTYNITNESCNDEAGGESKGTFGHYECDPPWSLVESSVKEMKQRFNQPKFIIWGGDNGHHAGPNTRYSVDYMAEIVKNITDLLIQEFPGVTVLPVLGNHDWWPKNQLPDDGTSDPDDLYDRYYEMWKEWIPSDQEANFKRAGFFSVKLDNDLITAIVLNTNLYLGSNDASSGDDPGNQFQWLTEQLAQARGSNSKVHIITHVPAAQKMMLDKYNKRFVDIIVSYSDAVQAVYGAHLHFDQFGLFFNESVNEEEPEEAVSFMLLLPSVSPWRWSGSSYARNPTFRQISYSETGKLQDYEQFYLDLPEANHGDPKWEKLYRFSEAYGKNEITAATMWSLARDLQNHRSDTWAPYFKHRNANVGTPYDAPCDCECKAEELCAMWNLRNDPFGTCMGQIDITCAASYCYATSSLMILLSLMSLQYIL